MYRLCTVIALSMSALVASANGQQSTTYRVIDLGKISDTNNAQLRTMQFWNNHLVTLPFRINSTGQVAFYRSQGTPGQQNLTFTPLLWLAEEDTSIGLTASPIKSSMNFRIFSRRCRSSWYAARTRQ